MSDFLKWLYTHYIKPYLDTVPPGDYDFHFNLMRNEMLGISVECFEKSQEFTAVHAFLLGLHTGQAIPGLNPPA